MGFLACPHLGGQVEFSEERWRHIKERHPDLLPEHEDLIALTLGRPDHVRRGGRFANARLFSRWYNELRGGKHVVVVVVSEHGPSERHWIVTAYITRRLLAGEVPCRPS